jgi:pilus assembly protein CpaD
MRKVLVAALALCVTGCYGTYVDDYRARFPVAVERDQPVLLVNFAPNSARLDRDEAARIDSYLLDYRARNSGPLRVSAQGVLSGDRLASERLAALEARAVALGIPKSALDLRIVQTRPAADAAIYYERYTARVPECGDWSKNESADATNTPTSNYGCATQRYLGLMVADPKDLLQSRTPGDHDTMRMSDQIRKYRVGAPTGAANGASETTGGGGASPTMTGQ